MKALYVTSGQVDDSALAAELSALDPALEIRTVVGSSAALAAMRSDEWFQAVFMSPHLPHNESLALIAALRRDRVPVAMVAIITEDQRSFFAPAITAGADDVLVRRGSGFLTAPETLRRVRHSRHLQRPDEQPPLRVLYVGLDDQVWDLVRSMPFVVAERTSSANDGSTVTPHPQGGAPEADVYLVDEQAGGSHVLQAVKWFKAHAHDVPLVVLTSPTGGDLGSAALDIGADDVVSKAGTYGRRLIATLHRHYFRKVTESPDRRQGPDRRKHDRRQTGREEPDSLDPIQAPEEEQGPEVRELPGDRAAETAESEAEEIARIRAALAAEARLRDLSGEVQSLNAALEARGGELEASRQELEGGRQELQTKRQELEAQRHELETTRQELETRGKDNDQLQEAYGFERAMRERDREELAKLHQSLGEERERRIVLEGTLRQTEDRAVADLASLEASHASARQNLEQQLATAADRLHQVANETQVLQTRLQNELTAQAVERDRITHNDLIGSATVALDGTVVRCNSAFARIFGFDDVRQVANGELFAGLADHAHVVQQLQAGVHLDSVEAVLRRANGRVFHVLTSAAFATPEEGGPQVVERVVFDVDDRTRVGEQLRIARRLEAAGRLAAEMSGEIDPLLPAIEDPAASASDRQRVAALVRQLLAFSRRQAKPAGVLSLEDAITRAEPWLRQIVGDGITFELRIEDAGTIVAADDDVEQLLGGLVFAAAGTLPYGGTVVLSARPVRTGFDQHTELSVGASGYGVHTAPISSSLARLVTRCGGTVRVTDEPARTTALHVNLPC